MYCVVTVDLHSEQYVESDCVMINLWYFNTMINIISINNTMNNFMWSAFILLPFFLCERFLFGSLEFYAYKLVF